jgi:hypothetical protein
MIFLFYVDNLLDIPFKKIEDIITRTYNPIYVRQSIAERFALILPKDREYINDRTRRRKRSSGENSITSSTSSTRGTPIELDSDNSESENVTHKKARRSVWFLIKDMIEKINMLFPYFNIILILFNPTHIRKPK